MHNLRSFRSFTAFGLADTFLLLLLVTVTFLLACYQLTDPDVWCHLAGGQWIMRHGVPGTDPFSFGAQETAWVDVNWGFQLVLAELYGFGGASALIVLAAGLSAATTFIVARSAARDFPVPVCILCLLPGLVLISWRLDPRPETLSLLFLAIYFAILPRLADRPALVWVLACLQMVWVNTSALFILGPILVLFFIAGSWWDSFIRKGDAAGLQTGNSWRRLGIPLAAVVGACFINPYLFRVFLTPWELFTKLVGFYKEHAKEYFGELMSLPQFFQKLTPGVAGANWYVRAQCILLLVLPLSFVFPAIYRAAQADRTKKSPAPFSTSAWLTWFVFALSLLVVTALTMPAPSWITWTIAVCLELQSLVGSVKLRRHSRRAGMLTLAGGFALAAWQVFLTSYLCSGTKNYATPTALVVMFLAGTYTLYVLLRGGASLFRLLAATVFAFLGWQAIRHAGLFGLVGSVVLCQNLGEWLSLLPVEKKVQRAPLRWGLRLGLGVALTCWTVGIVSDQFFAWTGEPRQFGLDEKPLVFAHDAIRFAGQPGLPRRALVYDLGQAGLFLFHNGPEQKTFMDGRLELPRGQAFNAYVNMDAWLNRNVSRWQPALQELQDLMVVLCHERNFDAEASLLAHPDWRLIYYDIQAAVFIPRRRSDLQATYPSINFAARYFGKPGVTPAPGALKATAQMDDFHRLAVALRHYPDATWKCRIPVLLCALDLAPRALREQPLTAWTVLGTCYWDMVPDLKAQPASPGDDWDPAGGLYWAQATYCHRQALEFKPDDTSTLAYLGYSFGVRRMVDAERNVKRRLAALSADPKIARAARQHAPPAPSMDPVRASPEDLLAAVSELLKNSLPKAAVDLFERASRSPGFQCTWQLAERVAPIYLHMGRPADARRVWERPGSPCPEALRLCRVASTYWVERDFETAVKLFHQALTQDTKLGEAYWGLAMVQAQLGQADLAIQACRHGLKLTLTACQRGDLLGLEEMIKRAKNSEAE